MSINNASATGTRNDRRDIPLTFSAPQPENITPYVRPADWLTMPTVLSTDQTVVLLVAVENCTTNFFSLSCTVSGGGTYTVNWGDGTSNSVTASGTTTYHNFDWNNVSSGTLTTRGYRQAIVTITPTSTNLLTVDFTTSYVDSGVVVTPPTGWNNKILESVVAGSNLTSVTFSGTANQVSAWMEQTTVLSLSSTANLSGMYNTCRSLRNVVSFPNGNYVNLPFMFSNCITLQVAPNFTFATSGVSMQSMFSGCNSLISVPVYNTIGVTNMAGMFNACNLLTTAPFLNTVNVTDMSTMFNACQSITSVPPYNTGNVTTMTNMFANAISIKTVPSFNTVKVTTTTGMFNNCVNLITAPPFNLIACTNASSMFAGCQSLQTVPPYNLPVCTTFASMFLNCFTLISVGTITTSGLLTTTNQMFSNCRSLLVAPLITNTTNVTDMNSMFNTCYALTSVPVYDTANVTIMSGMFNTAYSLTEAPAFNTIKVTNMNNMFTSSGIRIAPSYNTSNVVNMQGMFQSARQLTTIPTYDTIKVTIMQSMLQDTPSLQEIPAFNLSNVTNLQSFAFQSGVRRVDSGFNPVKATNITGMFATCNNLVTLPTTMSLANVTSAGTAFSTSPGLSTAPGGNLRATTSYASDLLGKTALENIFLQLGSNVAAPTVTITGNPGTVAAVAKTGDTFNNASNIITIANTVGLTTGMTMSAIPGVSTNIAATFTAANGTVTLPTVLTDNSVISFSSVTTSNVSPNTLYYTQYFSGSGTSVNYKLRTDPAGANINLTSGTGVARINTYIESVTTNVQVTINYVISNSLSSQSPSFRSLNTNYATYKNWTVTG